MSAETRANLEQQMITEQQNFLAEAIPKETGKTANLHTIHSITDNSSGRLTSFRSCI
jgi:hypothetical protein